MAFENSTILPSPLSAHAGRYLLETITASSDASIDFTTGFDSSIYDRYEIDFDRVVSATDHVSLRYRVSTDGGSTWDSGASTYGGNAHILTSSPTHLTSATNLTSGYLNYLQGTAAGNEAQGCHGRIEISGLTESVRTSVRCTYRHWDSAGYAANGISCYTRQADQVENGFQIFYDSGNIASGTFKLYGIK